MKRLNGIVVASAAVPLLLLGACARPADGQPAAAGSSPATESTPTSNADTLVLRTERYGGFVPASSTLGRIPEISVYADGRVITPGPVPAIYPGPALPNILVQMVDPATVKALVAEAKAVVKPGTDYGRPGVADAQTTQVTVDTGYGRQVVAVEALTEAQPNDPRLTAAQKQARAKLAAFVKKLSGLPADKGVSPAVAYQPSRLAVLSQAYAPQSSEPAGTRKTWVGAALPGPWLYPNTKVGCQAFTGAAKDKILAAAKASNKTTPWADGGKQYLLTFRPLLPDEASCAVLKTVK